MTTPSLHRKIVFLLLLSTLAAAPWAAAGPRRESPRAGKTAASLVFDVVSRVWSRLTGLQTKEGCGIDPDGHCLTGASPAPPPATETGCGIDPSGCASAQTESGCGIDPDGRCGS
ncbi:MAG TPA: hypothetical protein VE685_00910 [Thermoanaerobaculia bacterium]|nr:hypothetical protein [Thermoanaerobaculia bacterium]